MKLRPRLTMELLLAAALVMCTALAVALCVLHPMALPWVATGCLLILVITAVLANRLRSAVAGILGGAALDTARIKVTLANLSTPALVVCDGAVVWYNQACKNTLLNGQDAPLETVERLLPGLDPAQCMEPDGQFLRVGERVWQIFCARSPGKGAPVDILILTDETVLRTVAAEYKASRPGCLLFSIDGYDDVFGELLDSERARLLEALNRTLEQMTAQTSGFLRRFGTGRYLMVVEERHLEQFAQQRYKVLDAVRAIDESVHLSVSIGVGRGGTTLHDCYELALQALDMAQGRGGDQAAERTPDGYTFYGGVSQGVEKRSRVRSRQVAVALENLIRQAESVVIMGHRQSDLDAIGAAEGVLRICKLCDVPAVIAVRRNATLAESLIERMRENGCADDFIEPEEALPLVNKKTLCVIVDTYRRVLVESTDILDRCGTVVVIDHHRKMQGFIENADLVCHEAYASSASELVTEMLQYVGHKDEKTTRLEAEALLAGIMLDTRNFSLHTGARTFEAAAFLRRCGAETESAKQLFNTSLAEYKAKCALVEGTRLYRGCAISMSGPLPPEMKVAVPQAANDLLSIEGVQASFVGVQRGGAVHISARSMGEVNVQVIMEALGGGGHQSMAATQLRDTTLEDAYKKLCAAIDRYRAAQSQGSAPAKK